MIYLVNCIIAFTFIDTLAQTIPHKICAYLDPGTGSIIIQVLIAGLCGGLLVVKLCWSRIQSFFKNLFTKDKEAENK